MTWQGSGGTGAPGDPDDDATRTDFPVPAQPTPPAVAPPDAPPSAPPGLPPAPQAPAPWAPPVAAGGSWASVPPDGGRFAVPGAPGLVYGGTLPRFVAYLVDLVLLAIVSTIVALPFAEPLVTQSVGASGTIDASSRLMAPTAGIGTIIMLVIDAAYFVLLWASAGRATLGMRLMKLQVGDATSGNRIPIPTAFRRWLAFGAWLQLLGFVPALAVGASLAVFAWQLVLLVTTAIHPQKMGLHDRFANTAMVRPANAGSGGMILGCLLIGLAFLILPIVALILLGSQMSEILSAVGESV